VPTSTISYHSEVYGHIEQWPPSDPICHVLLYRFALHRPGNGHHAERVKRCIGDRKMRAAELGSVAQVCDGAERLWLERARESATENPWPSRLRYSKWRIDTTLGSSCRHIPGEKIIASVSVDRAREAFGYSFYEPRRWPERAGTFCARSGASCHRQATQGLKRHAAARGMGQLVAMRRHQLRLAGRAS
jgi:hypothetical protein